jgi:hypothetical protein
MPSGVHPLGRSRPPCSGLAGQRGGSLAAGGGGASITRDLGLLSHRFRVSPSDGDVDDSGSAFARVRIDRDDDPPVDACDRADGRRLQANILERLVGFAYSVVGAGVYADSEVCAAGRFANTQSNVPTWRWTVTPKPRLNL